MRSSKIATSILVITMISNTLLGQDDTAAKLKAAVSPGAVAPIPIGQTGPQVDFPLYVPKETKLSETRVVTSVVNLYYFRNAARAAQIINRNIKSYNAPAVTKAQIAAASGRTAAETATATRKAEQAAADRIRSEIALKQREIRDSVASLKGELQVQAAATMSDLTKANGLRTTIETQIAALRTSQVNLFDANTKVQVAEDKETLALKNAFQLEVAAEHTDSDTFVPANLAKDDPVAQVSISVIGEGVLHLRGPQRGVLKVREMIDQIDQPVGQVKIGLMTVQINGSNSSRMEDTAARVSGNINRGRFLTYVSGQYFRRAVYEVAAEVADAAFGGALPKDTMDYPGDTPRETHIQSNPRFRGYMDDFFGSDFTKGLSDIDSSTPLLNPFHKLLALNSMDTVTLAEAMFVTALAKKEYRDQIMCRFEMYVTENLPHDEAKWVMTNDVYCKWDPRWWGKGKLGMESVRKYGERRYHFQAISSFFKRPNPGANDRLTPIQRSVIKLTEALTLLRSLRTQEESLELQLSLAEKAPLKLNVGQMELMTARLFLIQERHMSLKEALRGQKAAMDNVIKRAMVAMEDDVYSQFYDPAKRRVREAASEWDVELSSIEETSILTVNRGFGKVDPKATMDFNLPKNKLAITEAINAAKAIEKTAGPLLQDQSFLRLANGFSGASGGTQNVVPTESEQVLAELPSQFTNDNALEQLVPLPSIFKFETGTSFQVRPVVQPDGQSVLFHLNYQYSSDLLEAPDVDRSMGRIKRHFIDTEVQLGNLEWRNISTYEVALKVKRTGQGVPLLQDIPLAGFLFRPLPSSGGSLQRNIIIGQAVIYPTIDELMGLKNPATAGIDPLEEITAMQVQRDLLKRLRMNVESKLQNTVEDVLDDNPTPVRTAPAATPAVVPGRDVSRRIERVGDRDRQFRTPSQLPSPRQPTSRGSLIQPVGYSTSAATPRRAYIASQILNQR
ncbi:MAG: hypothetical protein O3A00_09715 [Planctomycetota bacterium]|nr:hypothetical protein [Planctomycetota bacterium]